jgi:Cu-Zn family superoxide dismutase
VTPLVFDIGVAITLAGSVLGLLAPESRTRALHATAELRDSTGAAVGRASLFDTEAGVFVRLTLTGVPAGTHALSLHDTGECDTPTVQPAGGRVSPTAASHGFKNGDGPHAGELPNVLVPPDGTLEIEAIASAATLDAGETAWLDADGAAIVLHADRTNPAGDVGDRLICGIIAP